MVRCSLGLFTVVAAAGGGIRTEEPTRRQVALRPLCVLRNIVADAGQRRSSHYREAVASFDPDVELTHPADYRLMMNTFVTLFWRREVLRHTIGEVAALGHDVVEVDATAWTTEQDLHRDMAAALSFPSYYGNNLNALNDCLSDVGSGDYGISAAATGLVLVIIGYDKFAAVEPNTAHTVLDIFARQARHAALIGHRMICLIQSDEPHITFARVGATPVEWNPAEWLNSSRPPE